jgi:hypothetical protein
MVTSRPLPTTAAARSQRLPGSTGNSPAAHRTCRRAAPGDFPGITTRLHPPAQPGLPLATAARAVPVLVRSMTPANTAAAIRADPVPGTSPDSGRVLARARATILAPGTAPDQEPAAGPTRGSQSQDPWVAAGAARPPRGCQVAVAVVTRCPAADGARANPTAADGHQARADQRIRDVGMTCSGRRPAEGETATKRAARAQRADTERGMVTVLAGHQAPGRHPVRAPHVDVTPSRARLGPTGPRVRALPLAGPSRTEPGLAGPPAMVPGSGGRCSTGGSASQASQPAAPRLTGTGPAGSS